MTSLNRPGGNVTGISTMSGELGPKRLGLLHQLLGRAVRFAALDNLAARGSPEIADLRAAAMTIGAEIEIVYAGINAEIDAAFASLVQKRTASGQPAISIY